MGKQAGRKGKPILYRTTQQPTKRKPACKRREGEQLCSYHFLLDNYELLLPLILSASKLVIKCLQRFRLPRMNPECFLSTEAFYFKLQDGRRVCREATAGAGKRIRKKWKAQHARREGIGQKPQPCFSGSRKDFEGRGKALMIFPSVPFSQIRSTSRSSAALEYQFEK